MGEAECWLDLDPACQDQGCGQAERRIRYAQFVKQGVPENELTLMREALHRGQLTGNDHFVDEVEQNLGSRIERRRPGRPASRAKGKG
jgi:putative transposase